MNSTLVAITKTEDELLFKMAKDNAVDYAVVYGEFYYQAGTWNKLRRVVFKIEKPFNQITHMYTFIVTNMTADIESII